MMKHAKTAATPWLAHALALMWLVIACGAFSAESKADDLAQRLEALSAELGLRGNTNKEFLAPDEAFAFSADAIDGSTIRARWQIADGYYMYRDKFRFEPVSDDIRLGPPQSPPGKAKFDESFGDSEVYYQEVEILLAVERQGAAEQEIALRAHYQGCADDGFCYPPIDKTVSVLLPAISQTATGGQPLDSSPASAPFVSEQDRFAATIAGGSLWLIGISFFGIGLLLAFTPCVFPMIPILSGIIVGQGKSLTSGHALMLSLVYVLAMALTYTVAGVLAGLFGANLQAAFQDPWVISAFVAVFIALSLSMFGFYELQMPSGIQTRLTRVVNSQKGGSFIGVGVMGVLSALIVGPCVAAPLAGALIYIGNSGDALLGGLALFAMSLGMGAPLLAIGASAGRLLPKAGAWMAGIKAFFGVLLLAIAIWMLERIVPGLVSMLLWSLLLIFSAVYLGAFDRIDAVIGWQRFRKGAGIALLLYGCLVMIGAVSGGSDVLQPLRGSSLLISTASSADTLEFKPIKGVAELEQEVARASRLGMPVMLDFYADWCVSCKEMEKYTFSDPAVQAALRGVVLLKADVTANDEIDQALLRHFGIYGPPSIMFYGARGVERKAYRIVGFMKAAQFKQHVDQALKL